MLNRVHNSHFQCSLVDVIVFCVPGHLLSQFHSPKTTKVLYVKVYVALLSNFHSVRISTATHPSLNTGRTSLTLNTGAFDHVAFSKSTGRWDRRMVLDVPIYRALDLAGQGETIWHQSLPSSDRN